jgi:RecA-family ATPase
MTTVILSTAKFDRDAIEQHFSHLHHAASRANVPGGKLVLAVYGEDPDTKEGFANVRHFEIGDHEGMTAAAMEFDGVPNRNVYAPLCVLRPDTAPGTRKEEDIAAVFGFVIDGDADKGKDAPTSPLPADYVVESSSGNLQEFLFLDRPLPPAEAKAYGRALKRATRADSADDTSHVWRVPGGLNWPNRKKVHERGRPRDPQPVTVKQLWSKWTSVSELRTTLEPHWKEPRVEHAPGVASPDLPKFDYDKVARWLDRKVAGAWKDDPSLLSQGDWALLGKAIKLSFPNEDGFELWMKASWSDGEDKAERRWNDPRDFPSIYIEGMRTLAHYTKDDVCDWMFGDSMDILKGKLIPSPSIVPDPPPGGWPMPGAWQGEAYEEEATSSARELPVFSAASLEGLPVPPRKWHVRDWIPAETVTLLYGDGGVGKSLLALQLLVSTAIGRPWIGRLVEKGACLFVTAEDSRDEVHYRLSDVARETGVPLGALTDLHIVSLAGEDAILAAADGRSSILQATPLFAALEAQFIALRPRLVVLDTLADLFGGNEIDRSQARQFIGLLRGLALKYNTTVLLLAHPSLSGMSGGKGTSGSTGWNNSVRSRLYLLRVEDESGREADTDARVLRSMKSNYGRVGDEINMRWQRGMFAPDRLTAGGDPMVAAARAERVFTELLKKYIGQNRYVSTSEGKSYAPFIFRSDAAKEGVTKKELQIAMEQLLAKGTIENAPHGAPSKKMYRLYVNS